MGLSPVTLGRCVLRRYLAVAVVAALTATACGNASGPSTTAAPDSVTATDAAIAAGTPEPSTSPSSSTDGSVPTFTTAPRVDPIYFTFESTLECDPDSEQAALQVAQAFFTAYNERSLDRLERLAGTDLDEIFDPSAWPHTGEIVNTDLASWAQAGWEIDDRLELVSLVDYGRHAGSDIILIRRNELIEALRVDGLVVGFKVPSSGCTVSRLIGHIDQRAVTNCPWVDIYGDDLDREITAGWETPSVCTR